MKFRAGLDAGSWRRHGDSLLRACAGLDRPVLLVIDELPIFLKRLLQRDGNAERVDEFLSWLRGALQELGDASPVLIVSGSIGLEPLVRRLALADRINHLYPVHVGPWDRDASVGCLERLAADCGLALDDGVGNAVFEGPWGGHSAPCAVVLRSPAGLRDDERGGPCGGEGRRRGVSKRTAGPVRVRNDLVHYEMRLKEALGDEEHRMAMEILAEAAMAGAFTNDARQEPRSASTRPLSRTPGNASRTRWTCSCTTAIWSRRVEGTGSCPDCSRTGGRRAFRNHHVPAASRVRRRDRAGGGR